MRQMTMEQLPPLLQKYAHEIRALDQKDPVARLLGFQTLYARVLASALRASPTVFVVDYAENLDDCSLRVLLAVALDPLIEMDCDSETGGPAGAIILTTCEVLMYRPISGAPQAPQPVPVQDLGAQLMHLKGLSGTAIDKMAEQILRCSAMTEELSSLLRGGSVMSSSSPVCGKTRVVLLPVGAVLMLYPSASQSNPKASLFKFETSASGSWILPAWRWIQRVLLASA